MQVTIESLSQKDENGFNSFYDIYKISFPASEQKSKEELLSILNSSDYTIFTSKISNEIVGFCVIFHPARASFYLLEYMAINERKRGLGIGSKLFYAAVMQTFSKQGIKPVIIEIDSPEETSNEKDIREKRELFYKRLGCRKIEPFDYILPIKSSQVAPLMKLLVYHSDIQNISKSQLMEWVEDIYTFVYGCTKDDERIDKMFSNTPKILKLI
ncbi:MAG: GNAT family N-acetyltransferase [Sulfurimonas sp.]|uniref:GNAT family N-acetyltransferase n=1 Tax=Sulfurimonas sp. TaxID=2022749 RepID=UPI00260EDDF8|nr:GNAT family N-acetyltransferase [Sulfurimonas sp.]MDD2652938.1 GNAT family N-acetyltransferase [Sulfurimonas sp.]MDD3452384.1 GNAT family N-acetyltransferase [Sulfurimonas sp.]